MEWMFVSLQFMIETLPSTVMILGDRAFGRKLELDEVMRVGFSWMGIVPL